MIVPIQMIPHHLELQSLARYGITTAVAGRKRERGRERERARERERERERERKGTAIAR